MRYKKCFCLPSWFCRDFYKAGILPGKAARRNWRLVAGLLWLIFILANCQPVPRAKSAAQPQPKPNFILILADDLGYGDLGCYGNSDSKTPHLDALARAGIRFTDFHSNGAICSPTRAALLTGRYQQRAGIEGVISARNHRDKGLALAEVTFAEVLQQAGYATALFGKWHLGYARRFNPIRQGFGHFSGYVSGNVDYQSHIDQEGYADWWKDTVLTRQAGYSTSLITDHGLRFIRENKQKPFCLYLAHEAPHSPYQGPGDKADRTVGGKFPVPGSRADRKEAYKEMIEALDQGVGQIVAAVQQAGIAQNTFIFFLSDNGATSLGSNGTFSGQKGQLLEGGHRVPAIACWPGKLAAGQQSDLLLLSMDLFPTLAAAAGVPLPPGLKLDGENFLPWLCQEKKQAARLAFWRTSQEKVVRQGNWKLLVNRQTHAIRLFNLSRDGQEKQDLSGREPARVKQLLQELARWESQLAWIPMQS